MRNPGPTWQIPRPSATAEQSRRLTIGFNNWAHAIDHFVMLIFPTVVIGLEVVYGRPYARTDRARHRLVRRLRHLLAAGRLARRPLEPPQHDGGVLSSAAALALAAAAFAPNLIVLAVALFALGMFAAIYHPVGTAMLVAAATNRGRTLAFNGVCGNLGVSLAAGITAA